MITVSGGRRITLRILGAKEEVVNRPWIYFARHRQARSAPGNVGGIKPRVSDQTVNSRNDRIDAQFERRDRRQIAQLAHRQLIDRNSAGADIFSRRLVDVRAGEKVGRLGVMPITFMTGGFIQPR